MTPKLIKGENLTSAQRAEVKSAFIHRFTGEHRPKWVDMRRDDGIHIDYLPTHATDNEWINAHAFYIRKDGHIATRPATAMPAWMTD